MKHVTEQEIYLGKSTARQAAIEELLELEHKRIMLLVSHKIKPKKPWWWNSDQLGLWPAILARGGSSGHGFRAT